MAKRAEDWLELDREWYRERSDATDNILEKNIIEARYNWAILRLRRQRVTSVLDVGCGLGYGTNLIFKAGFRELINQKLLSKSAGRDMLTLDS